MVENLTIETFKEKIFDFENESDWKYKGGRPAIIDFYADWCGPCKMLAPILDELASEYNGKVDIYKVDVDKERELTQEFGVMSMPSLLFIPLKGKPQMVRGAIPKGEFEKIMGKLFK